MSTIYHNPACGTSRNVLAILRAAGEAPEVVDYLKAGWNAPLLRQLFAAAGLTAAQALRVKGTPAAMLGLTGPEVPPETIIAAMIEHPILVERPFVVTPLGTALCRPAVEVGRILPHQPATPVLAADGKVIYDPQAR
ncbi:arsenate reductase (glutaredoxin) [Xinfangfangia sp. D13-10-4-6]|uniref:arsenate reductase (glutaredoxin) n=1 Tax=Pseudogemmobacter hezensis TaxID=2737662 RepID=UPI001551F14B|nr:arsenate reductase (glutaredoxin) [Pseudogemmobacter hezensis]NPD15544.1 arsenate reductase (glutaredoxin) [Pseudogemmobacter hezensis]